MPDTTYNSPSAKRLQSITAKHGTPPDWDKIAPPKPTHREPSITDIFDALAEPAPAGEQKTVARLWEDVQKKAKIDTGLEIRPFSALEMLMGGFVPPNLAIGPDMTFYTPGVTRVLKNDEIAALLAHELGHFSEGIKVDRTRTEQHDAEYKADAFAARLGYGEASIRALQWFAANHPIKADGKSTHPRAEDRIAAIRRILKSLPESQLNLNLQEAA
jgi:Zn-dependent protease with chaperone function